MRKRIVRVLALVCAMSIPTASQSQARCPAGQSGCTVENAGERILDRANEGKNKVLEGRSPSERLKEAGKTLQDCLECGRDALKEGLNRRGGTMQ